MSIDEIKELIKFLKKINYKKIILCHCVSEYPVRPHNANLQMIKYLKKIFDGLIGYSDHTLSFRCTISTNYGVKLIEKHFTNSNNNHSLDSSFSSDPKELELITSEVKRTFEFGNKLDLKIKSFNKKFRRSIIAVRDIKKGKI